MPIEREKFNFNQKTIPGWQKHLKPSSWSTHIPCTHGDDSHSFKLCWHNGPVKPGGHSHLKGNVEFAFLLNVDFVVTAEMYGGIYIRVLCVFMCLVVFFTRWNKDVKNSHREWLTSCLANNTWNVSYCLCMYRRWDIEMDCMGQLRIDSSCPCILLRDDKKID